MALRDMWADGLWLRWGEADELQAGADGGEVVVAFSLAMAEVAADLDPIAKSWQQVSSKSFLAESVVRSRKPQMGRPALRKAWKRCSRSTVSRNSHRAAK